MLRHSTNSDGTTVYFFESEGYVTSEQFGRRDPANHMTGGYSVSYYPAERSILAYFGGYDVTETIVNDYPGFTYSYGLIYGNERTVAKIVNLLEGPAFSIFTC